MTAVMQGNGRGVLTCNGAMPSRFDVCPNEFLALQQETVERCEARSRLYGWSTVEGFGSVAHLCPDHAKRSS